MEVLRLLNTIRGTVNVTTPNTRLMYLYILVNVRFTTLMIDIDIIHNFISVEDVKRLSLTIQKGELHMKAVNSEVKSIYGVTYDVTINIVSWSGNVNLSVAMTDD